MKTFHIGLMAVLLGMSIPLHAEDMIERDIRITDSVGPLTLKSADNPKQALTIDEETPLREGDVIETGPSSHAEMTLDGESVVAIQPGTRIRFKKIFYKNTQLEIFQGGILAKIKPATQPDQSMIIKLPTAIVAIRGTEFAAESANSIANVGVFDEGHVVVQGAWGHERVKLAPNQETRVTLSNVPLPAKRLTYFQPRRKQMNLVRTRVVFWNKHWKAMSVVQRHNARQRLLTPHRPAGFLKPKPVKRVSRPNAGTRSRSRRSRNSGNNTSGN